MPETDTSIKLYTGPNLSLSDCSLLGAGRQPSGVWSEKTSERRERFVIWLLYRSFPCCFTSQGPPPNRAAWCLLCRSIHALSASSTSECRVNFRVLDESRYLKFSYRTIKFSKINIPKSEQTLQIDKLTQSQHFQEKVMCNSWQDYDSQTSYTLTMEMLCHKTKIFV